MNLPKDKNQLHAAKHTLSTIKFSWNKRRPNLSTESAYHVSVKTESYQSIQKICAGKDTIIIKDFNCKENFFGQSGKMFKLQIYFKKKEN